jgi:uncharacterized membrane protein (UPF0127 family)
MRAMVLLTWLLGLALVLGPGCKKDAGPAPAAPAAPPATQLPTTRLRLADETFTVELAYLRETRRQGLMFRESLPPDAGMLFIFENPRRLSFYMKNTCLDLDILFLDAEGRIVKIATMTVPEPGRPLKYYYSGAPAQYALEVAAGTATRLHLAPGGRIHLPPDVQRILPEPD